jgi:CheY-like chemotaxis protein
MKRRLLAAIDDILFISKVRTTAEHLGVEISFPKRDDALLESARANSPSLIIVDLHSQRFNPFKLAEELKKDEALKSVPILGFFSHVQVELREQAINAGFDEVIPRSAFVKNLVDILKGE